MSGYINFYLVPKQEEGQVQKPLLWVSYSRSTDIYKTFYERVAFAGIDREPNYIKLTSELVNNIVSAYKEDYDNARNAYTSRMDAYKAVRLGEDVFDKYVDDVVHTEQYLAELRATIVKLECLANITTDISTGYTDFKEIQITFD